MSGVGSLEKQKKLMKKILTVFEKPLTIATHLLLFNWMNYGPYYS